MVEQVIVIILGILFSAVFLWVGMKVTKVDGTFPVMLGIAAASTLLGLLPLVGFLLGTVAMFALICALTDANFWPDAILLVLVAKGVAFLCTMFLAGILA